MYDCKQLKNMFFINFITIMHNYNAQIILTANQGDLEIEQMLLTLWMMMKASIPY